MCHLKELRVINDRHLYSFCMDYSHFYGLYIGHFKR